MIDAPVLLLGFNSPDRLSSVIESLRPSQPRTVYVSIDGPRDEVESDREAVQKTRALVSSIDWTDDVHTNFPERNLGIARAIPSAVSWVLAANETVVVLEDDVIVGPQFLPFAEEALRIWADDNAVFSISGYNLVPPDHLANPGSPVRLSRIPHSYAWATWRRAWNAFDSEMQWARDVKTSQLTSMLGSRVFALRWRQNFRHAQKERVSTWDYQWVSSIWEHNGMCVSPNRNLVTYNGHTGGSHTRRSSAWSELDISPVDLDRLADCHASIEFDGGADDFLQRTAQRATPLNVALGPLEAVAMEALKQYGALQRRLNGPPNRRQ